MVARIRLSDASLCSAILELFPTPEFETKIVDPHLIEVRSSAADEDTLAIEMEFAVKAWALARPGTTAEVVSIERERL
jgi:hypothetical protein